MRRRRGDPGNVFKTSCSNGLHMLLGGIQFLHNINQGGCHNMRQVADGSSNKVMFIPGEDHRQGADGRNQLRIGADLVQAGFL